MKLGQAPEPLLLARARQVPDHCRDQFFAGVAAYSRSRAGQYRGRWSTELDVEDAVRAAQAELKQ